MSTRGESTYSRERITGLADKNSLLLRGSGRLRRRGLDRAQPDAGLFVSLVNLAQNKLRTMPG